MGSVKPDGEEKKDLDDSGYVQDEGPPKSSSETSEKKKAGISLLDLSDDVLLCILSFCGPYTLKALGFTCLRLAALIRDRTLWQRVDARDVSVGRQRLRWLLDHGLHAGTTHLYLQGYAALCAGCDGFVNSPREDAEEEPGQAENRERPSTTQQRRNLLRDPQNLLPRTSSSPSWPDIDPLRSEATDYSQPKSCPGPHFTLSPCLLRRLQHQCNLTHFQAASCNINCNTTPLSLFPSTLTHLSLRGTKCFNVPNVEKSFLFQIQDHLPNLEELDLSDCDWLEPTCLLPLSKLPKLKKLYMCNCYRMSEFVAYASLAGRYGFKKLQVLDLRGSPIGDSECSAFGWLPELEQLYVSACRAPGGAAPHARAHAHHKHELLPAWRELHRWEEDEPEYFKKLQQQRRLPRSELGPERERCAHNLPFHKCTDGLDEGSYTNASQKLKRKRCCDGPKRTCEGPGPSKRRRSWPSSSHSDDDEDVQHECDVTTKKRRTRVRHVHNVDEVNDVDDRVNNDNGDPNDSEHDSDDNLEHQDDIDQPHGDGLRLQQLQPHFYELPNNERGAVIIFNEMRFNEMDQANIVLNHRRNREQQIAVEPNRQIDEGRRDRDPNAINELNIVFNDARNGQQNADGQPNGQGQGEAGAINAVNIVFNQVQNDEGDDGDEQGDDEEGDDEDDEEEEVAQNEPVIIVNQRRYHNQPEIVDDELQNMDAQPNEAENNEAQNQAEQMQVGDAQNGQPNGHANENEPMALNDQPNGQNEQPNDGQANNGADQGNGAGNENIEARPRAQVLYINLGRQNHPVFRAVIPGADHAGNISMEIRLPAAVSPSSLISDAAIRSFGNSDDDNVNYFHIGGPPHPQNARPSKSNLRILSMQGYKKITDRSLNHLKTAAPKLEVIDFSMTSVTDKGIERFKISRPDVKVYNRIERKSEEGSENLDDRHD